MINSLYLQWKRLRKIVYLYSKINVKNVLHYILDHTFQFPGIGRKSPAIMIFQSHLNCLVKSPTFRIHSRKSPAFTSVLIISRYDISFYIHTQHIFTHNIQRREVLGCRFTGDLKLLRNEFFFVTTLNSKGSVPCSAWVCERLKMRKSLTMHYWQDIPSLVSSSIIML